MKVIIHCSDDVEYTIKDFDHFTVMTLIEALHDVEVAFVQLDIEGDMVHLNKSRIIQVVIKKEEEAPIRTDGEDFLDTVNGNLAWFHKCRIEGDITLSPNLGSCPHCGTIQITRRKP